MCVCIWKVGNSGTSSRLSGNNVDFGLLDTVRKLVTDSVDWIYVNV